MGYGQHYYTLRSIFLQGIPPPAVHLHLRRFDVRKEVPIGDISASRADGLPKAGNADAVEIAVPEQERVAFEEWLRARWRDKDAAMERWHATGAFVEGGKRVEIPLELASVKEVLDAFCFFVPALACYTWSKLRG